MFQTRHFVEIAKLLSSLSTENKKELIDAFVVMFHRFNVRFNEDRFRKACE